MENDAKRYPKWGQNAKKVDAKSMDMLMFEKDGKTWNIDAVKNMKNDAEPETFVKNKGSRIPALQGIV
mgnify:CR=1 FL=1